MKNEAGESREKVINMMNGKIDSVEVVWIEGENPTGSGENISSLDLPPSGLTSFISGQLLINMTLVWGFRYFMI